ncbi:MAG TPA: SusE domain-containing protein [Mariniflexile sp.]|nr:SusE domain-containing protein [Mariniflexile sp.]
MKNLKKKSTFILSALAISLFSSCTDTTDTFEVSSTEPVVLSDLAINKIELDAVNINNPALTLSWTTADYGQQASINYSVQMASDQAFTNAATVATVNGNNTVTLSVSELNAAAGSVGLSPFVWSTIYARVVSSIGTQNGLPVASNSVNFKVYPYFNYKFKDYYLVGNGTAPGWNNNDNNPALFRESGNSNQYYYIGYFKKASADFNEGRFKILESRGLWQPQWGVTENEGSDTVKPAGEMAGNPGKQSGGPGRFGVTASGYYKFTFNFSTKKYTMAAYDASAAPNFTGMEIQGSATTTKAMTKSAFDGHIWNLKSVRLVPGNLQFKTNTGAVWAGTTEFSGIAKVNGGNIPVVVEDDYEIWFNDLDGSYIMIPLNL